MRGFKMFHRIKSYASVYFTLLMTLMLTSDVCDDGFHPLFSPVLSNTLTQTRLDIRTDTTDGSSFVRFSFENNFPSEDFQDSIRSGEKKTLIKRENKNTFLSPTLISSSLLFVTPNIYKHQSVFKIYEFCEVEEFKFEFDDEELRSE